MAQPQPLPMDLRSLMMTILQLLFVLTQQAQKLLKLKQLTTL